MAHTNNRHSQNVIYEEKAAPTLLELLQNHRSLQVKVPKECVCVRVIVSYSYHARTDPEVTFRAYFVLYFVVFI